MRRRPPTSGSCCSKTVFAGLFNLGHHVEAERALGQALALAERSGSPGRLAAVRLRAGEFGFYNGRWDDAVAELDAASELPIDAARELMARGLRGLIAVHRDDQAGADEYLRQKEDPRATADAWYLGFYLAMARAAAAERENERDYAFKTAALKRWIRRRPGRFGSLPRTSAGGCPTWSGWRWQLVTERSPRTRRRPALPRRAEAPCPVHTPPLCIAAAC